MRLVHKIFYLSTLGERQTGATNLIKNENFYEIFLIFERSKNGNFVCPTDVKLKQLLNLTFDISIMIIDC